MKIKNIFICTVTFVIGVLAISPAFSEENALDRSELGKLIKEESKINNGKSKKTSDIRYFSATRPLSWAQSDCDGMKKVDADSVAKILKSKKIPNTCKQYDVMKYFIGKGDNANLQKVLDKGYSPLVSKSVDFRTEKLVAVAALTNNKNAFDILLAKIRENGLSVFTENPEERDIDDVIINELYPTVNIIIDNCSDCDSLEYMRNMYFQTAYFQINLSKDKQIENLKKSIYQYIEEHSKK